MAERPVFCPARNGEKLVEERKFRFVWHAGFAPSQKQRNIQALHNAAVAGGVSPVLEVSTKSLDKVGQHLSAFNLKVRGDYGEIPLECAFQGSKVFEHGGPYTDLYTADVRAAKRDPRLARSGRLVGFEFRCTKFALEPKTMFYDWLYVTALFPHRAWLERLAHYAGFTDIEFNPDRSINCQARSCALFFALSSRELLDRAVSSPQEFSSILVEHSYSPGHGCVNQFRHPKDETF